MACDVMWQEVELSLFSHAFGWPVEWKEINLLAKVVFNKQPVVEEFV